VLAERTKLCDIQLFEFVARQNEPPYCERHVAAREPPTGQEQCVAQVLLRWHVLNTDGPPELRTAQGQEPVEQQLPSCAVAPALQVRMVHSARKPQDVALLAWHV